MIANRRSKQPTFFWQGLLIVLPVVVLAAVGLLSLRQDKILAQHEAAEKAQGIADELAEKIWGELTDAKGIDWNYAVRIGPDGELLFPPPLTALVPQSFDPSELPEAQARLWQSARAMEWDERHLSQAIETYREFLGLKPLWRFAAAADFRLGVLLAEQRDAESAARLFEVVLKEYPDAHGETGLPLQPLAALKLLELAALPMNRPSSERGVAAGAPNADLLLGGVGGGFPTNRFDTLLRDAIQTITRHAFYRPSPNTGYLLQKAVDRERTLGRSNVLAQTLAAWKTQEQLRQLYVLAKPHLQTNTGPPTSRSLVKWQIDRRMTTQKNDPADRWLRNYQALNTNLVLETAVSPPRLCWLHASNLSGGSNGPATDDSAAGTASTESNWLAMRFDGDDRNYWRIRQLESQLQAPLSDIITNSSWLNVPYESNDRGDWLICQPEWKVQSALTSLVENTKQIPAYFGLSLSVAGKIVLPSNNLPVLVQSGSAKGSGARWIPYVGPVGSPPAILATATKVEAGIEYLRLNVHLISPQMLFLKQRDRRLWFGSLIAVSSIAAVIGLVSAWRAFRKQQRLSEMKTNFVSSVSHELRAPIASVRLMAESLDRGRVRDTTKQSEYFRFIVQECRRLSAMIENILDFSRIEQGRKEYEFEPTDVVRLVQETVKLMEPHAGERRITLSLVLRDSQTSSLNPQSVLDGQAIQQALVNLIDNAIKHSPDGSTVTVGLEALSSRREEAQIFSSGVRDLESEMSQSMNVTPSPHPSPPAGERVPEGRVRGQRGSWFRDRVQGREVHLPWPASLSIWVEDHGEGIPPAEHERIFERFYRLGSELRRETQGVGIGLSIVKHIVEAHGGTVSVRSEVGNGSRFTIEIPIKNETSNIEH